MAPTSVSPVRVERVRGWEPDPFFDPARVRAWADEVDVAHLHFSYDHLRPEDARAWVDALAAAHLPLVLTVHDLRNPHHPTRDRHDALLDVLVPAAAAVLTLTDAAAGELRARHGCDVRVVAHPTLVDPGRTADVSTEPGLVALHLKSLRTNVPDPLPVVAAAAEGAADGGGRLEVDVHPEALDDPRLHGLDRVVDELGDRVSVRVHERFDDLALERYLRRAHVTVLPYRWGTHSGWLELARDLGTRVVAPSGGHYAAQWPEVVGYVADEERGLDTGSLRAAVARAVRTLPPPPAHRGDRLAEASRGREVHAQVYAQVLAGRAVRVGG